VRRRLGPQVLKLLRCGVAAEYLVAVRVATEARYDVAGSLGLRNPKLGPRPAVGRRVGHKQAPVYTCEYSVHSSA
jgi:hypothetical protein